MVRNSISSNIRRFRRSASMTQDDLAEAANLSKNYICLLETGRRSPSLQALERISAALSIGVNDLIGDHEAIIAIRKMIDTKLTDQMISDLKAMVSRL